MTPKHLLLKVRSLQDQVRDGSITANDLIDRLDYIAEGLQEQVTA